MITEIELRENPIGFRSTPEGNEMVNADFWVLMVDDKPGGGMRQAGYVWKEDGGGISLIRRFSEQDKQTIHDLVQSEVGPRVSPNQPPEPIEFEEEGDEEDDDE